ncbi:MAG: hypothetical protein ACREEB_12760 [Caulobacteraceae bacterium]
MRKWKPKRARTARHGCTTASAAFATLIFLSNSVLAAPITLVCDEEHPRPDLQPHLTIDLNQGEQSVTIYYPATSVYYGGNTGAITTPARTVGPIAATFDARSVNFDRRDGEPGFYQHYSLDRLTGIMHALNSIHAPFDQAPQSDKVIWTYQCQLAKAKF